MGKCYTDEYATKRLADAGLVPDPATIEGFHAGGPWSWYAGPGRELKVEILDKGPAWFLVGTNQLALTIDPRPVRLRPHAAMALAFAIGLLEPTDEERVHDYLSRDVEAWQDLGINGQQPDDVQTVSDPPPLREKILSAAQAFAAAGDDAIATAAAIAPTLALEHIRRRCLALTTGPKTRQRTLAREIFAMASEGLL